MIVQIAEILQETREWYEKNDQLDLAGCADFGLFGDDQPGSVYVTVYVKRCGEKPRRFLFFTGENVKCKTQNDKFRFIELTL